MVASRGASEGGRIGRRGLGGRWWWWWGEKFRVRREVIQEALAALGDGLVRSELGDARYGSVGR